MQKLTVTKLESLIKEYKSKDIPTKDLEKKLESLRKDEAEVKLLNPVRKDYQRIDENPDGSRTIIFSTIPIPIDQDIDKISKQFHKKK
jgi:hypothetical protein